MTPVLLSANTGRVKDVDWGRVKRTAIDKAPTAGRVRVGRLGLEGDEVADARFHGGVDQAVYAFAGEELDHWAAQLGRELAPGSFGENLTTQGIDVDGSVIGSRWRIGSALLEVSFVRIPCGTFQQWLDERRWVRRFTEHGRPGAYLRVLEEGELGVGDDVVVEHVPGHGVTVAEVFAVMSGDREHAPRLLLAPELKAEGHERARELIALARG